MIEAEKEPPVRYSVGAPDFDPEVGRRIEVTLDGVVQDRVTDYDCEAGTLTRLALNSEGRPYLTPDKKNIVTEDLIGAVAARWKAG
jgi:hypothetical protein